jgi:hypothetical protein
MDSSASTRARLLAIINEETNSEFDSIAVAMGEYRRHERREGWGDIPVGICGFLCSGDCRTCTEAIEHVDAFFAIPVAPAPPPVPMASEASASVEGSGPSRAEESAAEGSDVVIQVFTYAGDEGERAAENALSLAAVEEMYRDGYYDDGYYEEEYDDDDGGYDNGWNESGYNDY